MTHRTILIVEDDQDIRESLRDAFVDEGYNVLTAANGRDGLDVLRTHPPPCTVVLDLIMPVMTGNAMYEAMQADPALAAIPVIISTSDPSRAPSGVLLVKKPVHLQTMLTTVEKFCGSGQPEG